MKRRLFLKLLGAVGVTAAAAEAFPAFALPPASESNSDADTPSSGYQLVGDCIFQWGTASTGGFVHFPLAGSMTVCVHAIRENGEVFCPDDHPTNTGFYLNSQPGVIIGWIAVCKQGGT